MIIKEKIKKNEEAKSMKEKVGFADNEQTKIDDLKM